MYPKNLGFITKDERTPTQAMNHALAEERMPRFAIPPTRSLSKGEKVMLTKAWADPGVVSQVGFVFPRFHQLTGSCVGAGGGQALFTLIAIQALLTDGATMAMIPWWPFSYGKSRLRMGDHGQGEGSLGSTFAEAIVKDGVVAATEQGLPQFKNEDGLVLTETLEMQWSDGDSDTVMRYDTIAKTHPMGAAAPCNTVADIHASIINGYPCSFACNNYIGNASIVGEGEDACVVGKWNGRGGHQQSVHAIWEHPNLGPLYGVMNNWPGSTYPKDPAGFPICGCWVKETDVTAAMHMGGEVYAFSHLSWFPAQPKVLDFLV